MEAQKLLYTLPCNCQRATKRRNKTHNRFVPNKYGLLFSSFTVSSMDPLLILRYSADPLDILRYDRPPVLHKPTTAWVMIWSCHWFLGSEAQYLIPHFRPSIDKVSESMKSAFLVQGFSVGFRIQDQTRGIEHFGYHTVTGPACQEDLECAEREISGEITGWPASNTVPTLTPPPCYNR